MPPLSPAAVLAARVALSLAVLAAPAVVVQHHAGLRASKAGQAGAAVSMVRVCGGAAVCLWGGKDGQSRTTPDVSPHTQLAALIPATCWYGAVGAVSHVVAFVVVAVSAGAGVYVGAWHAAHTMPLLLAALVTTACGALVAAGFAAGAPPVGTIAAAITACLFFGAVPETAATPPQGVVAAAVVVGLTLGGTVFLLCTWLIKPVWATDAAFRATAGGLTALADMVAAEPGATWERGGVEEEEEAGGDKHDTTTTPAPAAAADADTDTDIASAIGEPTRPRAPLFIRRRRRSAHRAASRPPFPPPPPRRPLPKVRPEGAPAPRVGGGALSPVDAAWLRLDASLAGAALAVGGARSEIASRGRLRAPWPPLLARAGVWHMPAASLAAVADAARAASRVVWCLHTLVGPLAPSALALVTRVHGGLAPADAVAPAARDVAAAIAAACPKAFGSAALPNVPLPVAAAELAILRAAVDRLAAARDAVASSPPDDALAAALIASTGEGGGLDELRFVEWETSLPALIGTLTTLAARVEELREVVGGGGTRQSGRGVRRERG